jgi:hypothetical protein
VKDVPNEALWAASPHNDSTAMAFNDWNDTETKKVPASCAKCHSTPGFQDFVGADGTEAGKVDNDADIGTTITCVACHNEATAKLSSVTFPSGVEITGLGGEARCMTCHQGRASKKQVDDQIAKFTATDPDVVVAPIKDATTGKDVTFGFINIHYFAAAATLYGTETKGGYEYDGKLYDWKHDHVEGFNTCVGCHDSHSLEVKVDQCAMCHGDGVKEEGGLKNIREAQASSQDYDGDGNVEEGMFFEIQGLQEALYGAIQAYAKEVAGTGLVYDQAAYPYFFADADGDGKGDTDDKGAGVRFTAWTPRLLKAAYNYQVSIKDLGAFAHGNKYIVQLLFDSIEDLNTKIAAPVDMSAMHRDDAGHFAGNTMPFRDWDAEGEVPFACAKCHSATGLPEFLKNGGTVVYNARGATTTAGVGAQPVSNGFACSTCHDEANWPNRYAITAVPFPSGATITFSTADADGKLVPNDANLCIECHQGRESTNSVNAALKGKELDTADGKISFKNIHYFAAGATLFGNDAKGAYQYDGKEYLGRNMHAAGFDTCVGCHSTHELEVKVDKCATCHAAAADPNDPETYRMQNSTADYDGDGDTTEGIYGEIETMREKLFEAMVAYTAAHTDTVGITYSAASYPYFFVDKDGDGKPDVDDKGATIRYNTWTPRLMRAAYNYQYAMKDTGAFAHNGKYVLQFLYDAIEDLGGDVTGLTRP